MKKTNETNILKQNMKEKTVIAKKIKQERKNVENSHISRIVPSGKINDDKRIVNRNKNNSKAAIEISAFR